MSDTDMTPFNRQSRTQHNTTTMENLPEVLLSEILCRLPANDLLRLKSISKQWKALITSPHFTKLHLTHVTKNPLNNLNLIIKTFTLDPQNSTNLYSIDFTTLDHTTFINPPHQNPSLWFEIAGSCNGILCLTLSDHFHKWVTLFNPTTRTHHLLPGCPVELPHCNSLSDRWTFRYGFGYDKQADDYKVVRVVQFYPERKKPELLVREVKVYSLKKGSWYKGKDIPYYFSFKFGYAFIVDGFLHWLGTETPEYQPVPLVIGYDVHTQCHHLVPTPEIDLGFDVVLISDFDGKLYMSLNYKAVKCDVWVMNEYLVRDSWVKLFCIRQEEILAPMSYIRVIGCVREGKKVLVVQDSASLVMYDLEAKNGVFVDVKGMRDEVFDTSVCLRSLVCLDGRAVQGGVVVEPKKIKKRDDFLSKGFKLRL